MNIKLFGQLQNVVGKDSLSCQENLSTVADLENWLLSHYPDLKGYQASWRVAVNHEYAQPEDALETNAEVAVMPPVSGGLA